MEQHDRRMECLRMAFELGGKADPVVSAAQQLLDFVAGPPSAVQPAQVATTEGAAEEQESARPADDAIAACGTVLVMPEGGGLEDAVQSTEPAQAATGGESAADVPSLATAEVAPEAVAPADGADAPAGEAQASSDASASQSSSTAGAAGATEPAEAAVEPLATPSTAEAGAEQAKADGQVA